LSWAATSHQSCTSCTQVSLISHSNFEMSCSHSWSQGRQQACVSPTSALGREAAISGCARSHKCPLQRAA
jgi:hypothetical protein